MRFVDRRHLLTLIAGACASAPALAQSVPVILTPTGQYPGGAEQARADMARDAFADRFRKDEPIVGCGKAQMLRARAAAGLTLDEDPKVLQELADVAGDTDLLNCNLDFEVLPQSGNASVIITGSNTMTVKSLVNGLTQFSFMLRSNYTATAKLNGSGTNSPITAFGSYGRRVTLDRAYNAGEIFTVRVDYSGTAVSRGLGSIQISTQNGNPHIESLSEPYYAATWWPVKDGDFQAAGDNADKFTAQIAITAPQALRSVSNGTLQGVDTLTGSRKKYRWATNYPTAPYLIAFCSSTYNTYDYTWNYTPPGGSPISMPFQINIWPSSDSAANRAVWEKALPMLTVQSDVYGTYPFANEKYGIYQFTFGGGMEHQTNTGQGGGFSESVTAHELGHQWWGDDITCRYWNDIWLNEGFADYTECLWEERKAGGLNTAALIAALNSRKPAAGSGSVYKYGTLTDANIFDTSTSYYKGGWVVHMLRRVAGDTVFFNQLLPAYRAAYSGKAASTNDFAAVVSSVMGTPMQYFFDQWVYGTGEPSYTYGFQGFTSGGQNYVRVVINQTQSTSYGANQKFIMPLDIRLGVGAGAPVVTVNNDNRNEWYVFPVATIPTSISVDPNTSILKSTTAAAAYTNGSAKVLKMTPAPGSETGELVGVTQAKVAFSENVACNTGDFIVTGPSGNVPFTFSYDSPSWTATLDFGANLPAGQYTVTSRDTITTVAAGIRLDGEVANPDSPASLPSGDGQALGNAVLRFNVTCAADVNNDDAVDLADFFQFLNDFDQNLMSADINGDTVVDLADFFGFLNAFDANC
jgi:aminopeptidase N